MIFSLIYHNGRLTYSKYVFAELQGLPWIFALYHDSGIKKVQYSFDPGLDFFLKQYAYRKHNTNQVKH